MLYSHKALRTVPGTSCVLSDENGGGRCGKERGEGGDRGDEGERGRRAEEGGGRRQEGA